MVRLNNPCRENRKNISKKITLFIAVSVTRCLLMPVQRWWFVNLVMQLFKRLLQTELKMASDKRLCFSKLPHQMVVIGYDHAEIWTISVDSALSLTCSFDIPVTIGRSARLILSD